MIAIKVDKDYYSYKFKKSISFMVIGTTDNMMVKRYSHHFKNWRWAQKGQEKFFMRTGVIHIVNELPFGSKMI
ncbi:hypothetical protein [Streptococcus sciuri]|uniref:hypothetical protein n=1 Tax=Streptococcus sciuri TaxID=2973939 RepID=UPI002169D8D8|nr:hypothetical protein [Streptococcus sciuri]